MAVARLSRVTLGAPRGEIGTVLARVIEFGAFHPSRREGMVQDIGIMLLASRAQSVGAKASELLSLGEMKGKGSAEKVERFEAHTVEDLVGLLEEYVDIIEKNLSIFTEAEDIRGVVDVLAAVREASAVIFRDLQRILVYPSSDGRVRFEGFVPTKSLEHFRTQLGGYILQVDPVRTQTKDSPYVPTLLVNPRVIAVFEDMTLQRGLPRYGQVDPTPILAFAFPLFFGIMFGDVGHGIVLLALGTYLVYRTTYVGWGKLILVLSSSTTLFGFLRGSFFGLTFVSPVQSLVSLPPAFSASFTLSYIPLLLEVAIAIGTFHLASGYAIAFVNQLRAGNFLDAYLNRLPTIVLYASTVVFGFAVAGTDLKLDTLLTSSAPTPLFDDLLGIQVPISTTSRITIPLMLATLAVLVLGHPAEEYEASRSWTRAVRTLGRGLVDALAKPFEFFVNTLSYMRLGVLLVTTTLLGSLVAGVMQRGLVGVLAALFINVAVIGLEGVIVYIQDMRLQLYEWFSQFYVGNGTPFEPLVSKGSSFAIVWN